MASAENTKLTGSGRSRYPDRLEDALSTGAKISWLAALLVAACGSETTRLFERADDDAEPTADAAPPLPPVTARKPLARKSTDALWKLAPAPIQFGAVVVDGGFEAVGAGLAELGGLLRADPEGAALWSEWTSRIREAVGFDLHDTRRWPSVGLDPARGGALFGTSGSDAVMVLPVGDLASFRMVFGLVSREVDGVTVDASSKLGYCVEIGDRYACADSAELIAAVAAGETGSLGRRAMALPDRLRGTVEIVADLGAFPGARRRLDDLAPALRGIGLLAIGARLEAGRMTVEGWLAGQRAGDLGDALRGLEPARSLRAHAGGAVGVVAAHLPIRQLLGDAATPGRIKIGRTDLGELLFDRLTGQIALITRGRGLAAGTAVIGLDDGAGLRRAMPEVCQLVGQLTSEKTEVVAGECRSAVAPSIAGLPVLPGLPPALRQPIPVVLNASSDAAVIAAGDTRVTGPAPGFVLEPAHLVAWGRSLDPLATAPIIEARLMEASVAARLDAASRRRLALIRRVLNHIYELGIRLRLDADGIRMSLDLVSFAADPAPVYAAYKIAVDRLLGGDHAGYQTQMAALVGKHPDSLAARQAEMVAAGTPAVGPGTALVGAIALRTTLKYIAR